MICAQLNLIFVRFQQYGCAFAVLLSDTSFKKLDHYKMHENQQRINAQNELQSTAFSSQSNSPPPQSQQHFLDHQLMQPFTQTYPTGTSLTSIDGLPILKRKRGRPPKNRVVEVSNDAKLVAIVSVASSLSPQMPPTLYPSFKFPKSDLSPQMPVSTQLALSSLSLAALYGNPSLPLATSSVLTSPVSSSEDTKTIPIPLMPMYTKSNMQEGFVVFDEGVPCIEPLCKHFCQKHFHCAKPRCYYVTNRSDNLVMHSKDFHENIDIMEGFAHFDSGVDCRVNGCPNNKLHRHYHCTRNGCNFSFIRYTDMATHDDKHKHETSALSTNPVCDLSSLASKSSATASQASSHSDEERELTRSPTNCSSNPLINNCNNRMQTVKARGTYYPLSSLSQRNFARSFISVSLTLYAFTILAHIT